VSDAVVEAEAGLVRLGEQTWPFSLDLRDGTAAISLPGGAVSVRPLTWAERVRLARFARRRDVAEEQFLRLSSPSGLDAATDQERSAVAALAGWLNAPAEGASAARLPLEPSLLAVVTLEVCRAMGLAPADLDARESAEVEELWHAAGIADALMSSPASAVPAPEPASTRILVVPDPAEPEPEPKSTEPETQAEAPSRAVTDRGVPEQTNEAGVGPPEGRFRHRDDDGVASESRRSAADSVEAPESPLFDPFRHAEAAERSEPRRPGGAPAARVHRSPVREAATGELGLHGSLAGADSSPASPVPRGRPRPYRPAATPHRSATPHQDVVAPSSHTLASASNVGRQATRPAAAPSESMRSDWIPSESGSRVDEPELPPPPELVATPIAVQDPEALLEGLAERLERAAAELGIDTGA
jgi:hypothetical protein